MQSDLSLIHAARFGDGNAFARLVDRYANLLFRFALRFVSGPNEAEELAHDTMVDFYRNLDRYEPRAALGTYLCAVLANKARYARRGKGHSPLSSREAQHQEAGEGPLHALIADERLMRVKKLVDELDDPFRLVVELHYMEGLKLKEVAEAMCIPVGTVKSRLSKALETLRGSLDAGEEL